MVDWNVGRVAANQSRGERPRLLEAVEGVAGRRLGQPPMQVEFVLDLAGLGIRPLTARGDHEGCRAEEPFKALARLARGRIALDRQRVAFREAGPVSLVRIVEGAQGR